jgi:hypothetical protein
METNVFAPDYLAGIDLEERARSRRWSAAVESGPDAISVAIQCPQHELPQLLREVRTWGEHFGLEAVEVRVGGRVYTARLRSSSLAWVEVKGKEIDRLLDWAVG